MRPNICTGTLWQPRIISHENEIQQQMKYFYHEYLQFMVAALGTIQHVQIL